MSEFKLSALAVRERSVTLFLVVAIAIAGVVAFLRLGRAEDPSFTIKQMTVVTAWPGATAKEMEEQVAEKLEKRMQELRWYDRTETFTRPGLAFTVVVLRDSTPPAEVGEEFYQARKKLGDEAHNLPPGVIGPIVNDEYSDVTFALYALKAKGEPHRILVRDAERLRQRLLHVPGVKKVNIIGEQSEKIFVEFSHDRLATSRSSIAPSSRQGQSRNRAAVPHHDRPHVDCDHLPGPVDLRDGDGVRNRTARPRRRRSNLAALPSAVRIQLAGRSDCAFRNSDAQHADSDRSDPQQRGGSIGAVRRRRRGHGPARPSRRPDRARRHAGVHSAHSLGLLEDAGVHLDRWN